MESPESWFHRRATLYVEAQILFHLNQAGVWDRLKRGGPLTAQQIADALRLEAGPTDALLDYVFEVDRRAGRRVWAGLADPRQAAGRGWAVR
jgi:hypothetical protein